MRETNEPKTLGVKEAGKLYFGLGRDASYRAAARGDLITIRVGRFLRVPIAAMDKLMAETVAKKREAA